MSDPSYVANPRDRCYHCKSMLYRLCRDAADKNGLATIVDGFNADDVGDWRPGSRAAHEAGVRSPLLEAGMTKAMIRRFSRQRYDLPTADRPASPCLASRIPYGTPITVRRLGQVERVEFALRRLGFVEVRARHHGDQVRIELPAGDMDRVVRADVRGEIVRACHDAGFKVVTLDLDGFRSGRLNEL